MATEDGRQQQWRRCDDAADGGDDGSVGIRDIKLEEADES
jgi:hypothetical protein